MGNKTKIRETNKERHQKGVFFSSRENRLLIDFGGGVFQLQIMNFDYNINNL
mgnify:CR=1 FL=1